MYSYSRGLPLMIDRTVCTNCDKADLKYAKRPALRVACVYVTRMLMDPVMCTIKCRILVAAPLLINTTQSSIYIYTRVLPTK